MLLSLQKKHRRERIFFTVLNPDTLTKQAYPNLTPIPFNIVQANIDLAITGFFLGDSVFNNGAIGNNPSGYASLYVRNLGTTDVYATSLNIYLSSNDKLDDGDEVISQNIISRTSPQSLSHHNVGFTIPKMTTAGNYFLIAKAESAERLTEINFLNNTFSKPIKIINREEKIDISLSNLIIENTALIGWDSLQFHFDIKNNSEAPLRNISYSISLDSLQIHKWLLTGQIAALDAGALKTIWFKDEINHPLFNKAGYGDLALTIKAGIGRTDKDSSDNSLKEKIKISRNNPDIEVISNTVSPAFFPSGKLVTISTTLKNNGHEDLEHVKLASYVSGDTSYPSPHGHGLYYGIDLSGDMFSIKAGEEKTVVQKEFISDVAGKYYLITFLTVDNSMVSTDWLFKGFRKKVITPFEVTNTTTDVKIVEDPLLKFPLYSGTAYTSHLTISTNNPEDFTDYGYGYALYKDTMATSGKIELVRKDLYLLGDGRHNRKINQDSIAVQYEIPDYISPGKYYMKYFITTISDINRVNDTIVQPVIIQARPSISFENIEARYTASEHDSVEYVFNILHGKNILQEEKIDVVISLDQYPSNDDYLVQKRIVSMPVDEDLQLTGVVANYLREGKNLRMHEELQGNRKDSLFLIIIRNPQQHSYEYFNYPNYYYFPENSPYYASVLINPDTHPTHTGEVEQASAFFLYPNPAAEEIFFSKNRAQEISSIDFYLVTGEKIMTVPASERIDVSMLQKGFYIVTLHTNQGDFTQKLIKQ